MPWSAGSWAAGFCLHSESLSGKEEKKNNANEIVLPLAWGLSSVSLSCSIGELLDEQLGWERLLVLNCSLSTAQGVHW